MRERENIIAAPRRVDRRDGNLKRAAEGVRPASRHQREKVALRGGLGNVLEHGSAIDDIAPKTFAKAEKQPLAAVELNVDGQGQDQRAWRYLA